MLLGDIFYHLADRLTTRFSELQKGHKALDQPVGFWPVIG